MRRVPRIPCVEVNSAAAARFGVLNHPIHQQIAMSAAAKLWQRSQIVDVKDLPPRQEFGNSKSGRAGNCFLRPQCQDLVRLLLLTAHLRKELFTLQMRPKHFEGIEARVDLRIGTGNKELCPQRRHLAGRRLAECGQGAGRTSIGPGVGSPGSPRGRFRVHQVAKHPALRNGTPFETKQCCALPRPKGIESPRRRGIWTLAYSRQCLHRVSRPAPRRMACRPRSVDTHSAEGV